MTTLTIDENVTTIMYGAFSDCTSLAKITIPDGIGSIGKNLFENCTSLKTFNFTRNMCRIRSRAFYGCTALQSITFEDADNMWGSSNGSEAKIASNAFEGCNSTLQMIAKKGSHVSDYCYRRGFTFVAK